MVRIVFLFICSCGDTFVGLNNSMVCPICNKSSKAISLYSHNPDIGRHQSAGTYRATTISLKTRCPPKLVLSIKEYNNWDLDKRCFWACCAGHMKINNETIGVGLCSVCKGELRVYS